MLEDESCCVVKSSFQDGWFSKNRSRRIEVSGDKGKAVWYMCWEDSWIGRKKWRVNRRQSLVRFRRELSAVWTFHSLIVNDRSHLS